MDHYCEFDKRVVTEDGIVGVIDIYHIKSYCFGSLGVPFIERDVQLDFAEGLYPFGSETNKRVL